MVHEIVEAFCWFHVRDCILSRKRGRVIKRGYIVTILRGVNDCNYLFKVLPIWGVLFCILWIGTNIHCVPFFVLLNDGWHATVIVFQFERYHFTSFFLN